MELITFFIKKKGEIEKQKQKAKKKAHIGFCGVPGRGLVAFHVDVS